MSIKFELGEYLTDVFVETGTGHGGNIIQAIHAGFPDIHGIEISPALYENARDEIGKELGRSPRQSNVMLYCGHPTIGLEQVCEKVQHKRATILLNSYTGKSRDVQEAASNGEARPLLDEIRIIRRWFHDSLIPPIVMIGGIKDNASPQPGVASPSLGEVVEALLDLCDDYQFRILDDDTHRNVLAALPPTWTQVG